MVLGGRKSRSLDFQASWQGLRLILVDDGRAKAQFDALPNSNVDPTKRKSLLTALLGDSDDPISIPTLATETAEIASHAAFRVAKIMSGPVREVVGKNRKESTFTAAILSEERFFTLGEVWVDRNVAIQGDPFSTYLKDGRALIWVWRDCGTLANNEKFIRAVTDRPHPADVYFYAENKELEWICRPVSELSLPTLKDIRYLGWFALGRAIPISNRSRAGVKTDLRRLIAWARER